MYINAITFLGNSSDFAVGTNTGDIFIYEHSTGNIVASTKLDSGVSALCVSKAGNLIIGDRKGQITIWDWINNTYVLNYKIFNRRIMEIVINVAGTHLAINNGKKIAIFDIINNRIVCFITPYCETIAICFFDDESLLIGNICGEIEHWDIMHKLITKFQTMSQGEIDFIRKARLGNRMIVSYGRTLDLWSTSPMMSLGLVAGEDIKLVSEHREREDVFATACDITFDSAFCATADAGGYAHLINLEKYTNFGQFLLSDKDVYDLYISYDKQFVLALDNDATAHLWNISNMRPMHHIKLY